MAVQILNVTREFCTEGNVRVGRSINGYIPEDPVGSANVKNRKRRVYNAGFSENHSTAKRY